MLPTKQVRHCVIHDTVSSFRQDKRENGGEVGTHTVHLLLIVFHMIQNPTNAWFITMKDIVTPVVTFFPINIGRME